MRVGFHRCYGLLPWPCSDRGFLAKLLEGAQSEGLSELDVIAQVRHTHTHTEESASGPTTRQAKVCMHA